MADPSGLLPLLVATPLAGAALLRVPGLRRWRHAPLVFAGAASLATAALGALVTVTAARGPVVHHVGGWGGAGDLPLGIALVADPLAGGFATLLSVLVTAVVVHLSVAGARGGGLTHVLTMLLLAAANGFLVAGDLFTMFVFLELFGITVYAVTAGKVEDPAALPAALTMAVTSTVGAVLLLTGVGLLHGRLGIPNLAAAATVVAEVGVVPAVALGVGLAIAGLAIKAGLVPFHFAHADLHTATTIQHAGLFGAVLLPLGIYGIARLHVVLLDGAAGDPVARLLLVGGASTAVVAAVMALVQTHLKRLLAFSSVSHLGIAAVGMGLATPEGTAASVVYVLGHAPLKLGLLLLAGLFLHRVGGLQVGALQGGGRRLRAGLFLLFLGGIGLAGAPPSGLYAGKAALADAAAEVGASWAVPVVYVAAALTGAAVVRLVAHTWFGWPVRNDPIGHVAEADHEPSDRHPLLLAVLPALLVVAGLVTGIVPALANGAALAGSWFHDRAAYLDAVLGSGGVLSVPADPASWWSWSSLVPGLLASAGAVLIGVVAARVGQREPGAVGAPVRGLRRLHTGQVGDYVAWCTLGSGAVVGWVVLTG